MAVKCCKLFLKGVHIWNNFWPGVGPPPLNNKNLGPHPPWGPDGGPHPFRLTVYTRRSHFGRQKNLQRVLPSATSAEGRARTGSVANRSDTASRSPGEWEVAWLLTHVEDPLKRKLFGARGRSRQPATRDILSSQHERVSKGHRESQKERPWERRKRRRREQIERPKERQGERLGQRQEPDQALSSPSGPADESGAATDGRSILPAASLRRFRK